MTRILWRNRKFIRRKFHRETDEILNESSERMMKKRESHLRENAWYLLKALLSLSLFLSNFTQWRILFHLIEIAHEALL